jgi:hypothetical protein
LYLKVFRGVVLFELIVFLVPAFSVFFSQYLVPGLLVMSVNFLIILKLGKDRTTYKKTALGALSFFVFVSALVIAVDDQIRYISSYEGFEDQNAIENYLAKHKDYAQIFYYRSALPFFGILSAIPFSDGEGNIYSKRIAELYTNRYVYNIADGKYFNLKEPLDIDTIKSRYHDKVLYIGFNPVHLAKIKAEWYFGKTVLPFATGKYRYKSKTAAVIEFP